MREIVLLAKIRVAMERGMPLDRAVQANKVWRSRQGLVKSAVRRLEYADVGELLSAAADVDNVVKGAKFGRPWDALTNLVMSALEPRGRGSAGQRPA